MRNKIFSGFLAILFATSFVASPAHADGYYGRHGGWQGERRGEWHEHHHGGGLLPALIGGAIVGLGAAAILAPQEPVYAAPPPVYVQPQPVYVPAPVYAPAPVYVVPQGYYRRGW